MNSKIIANGILRAIAIIIGVLLLLFFLYKVQSVIVYIIIAAILSLIGRPFILFLRNKLKFPNSLAVVTTMLFMLSLLTGLVVLFIPLVVEQGRNLSLLEVDVLQANIQEIFKQAIHYFSSKGIDVLKEVENINFASPFETIPNLFNSIIAALGYLSIGVFSVLFISFFMMKDSGILKQAVLTLIPDNTESRFSHSLEIINTLLSQYFLGLILQISILFVLYTIILLSFDISNAVVIAFLCALLNLIPYVGPIIGAILVFCLSMISNIGLNFQSEILPTSLWILFFYSLAQIVDNFISQPIIFSKTTKSQPLEIFLIIIIGGLLFGVIGMMTAVPIYTALKVILKEFLADNKIVKSLTKNI
ncbi:AI-2E family transporter [Polaribacter litorisediminis]|uniref:AI-2E family transporter n=1 Tax=Polaribacter litorisediminis TaxID=1908341 RepID=UPI001CBEC1B8|nr:AI-2E family transporter [Polaribacter litorisediminis]UAM96663.1 AI-2E family transporter [Polaribacter litorisediminis]